MHAAVPLAYRQLAPARMSAALYYFTCTRYLSKIVHAAEILTKLFAFTVMDPVMDEHTDDGVDPIAAETKKKSQNL